MDPARSSDASVREQEATASAVGLVVAPSDGRTAVRRRLMPFVVAAVLALGLFLLYRTLSRYDPAAIVASIATIPGSVLALTAVFAAASYLCLTGFDALGVRYVGRARPYRSVALTSFVSLSIGHNIGFSALSTGAIRYRFYSRLGLRAGEVARIVLFSGSTVGVGLIILGAAALLLQPSLAAEVTGLGPECILGLGVSCLVLALGYLGLAAWVRRPLRLGRWSVQVPSLGLALGQVIVGPLNFACVAASLHQPLAAMAEVSYPSVAAAYVVATLATLITHVPGGLGVVETVVIFLLPGRETIGALIVFRVVYFLVPLALVA